MYPVPEAARLMRIDRSGLYELIATGQIDWVDAKVKPKGRKRIRIPQAAIEKFMAKRLHPAKRAA